MNKITLTQKERMLLEDQKHHEEMCIQKYTNFANQASDPQLKQLFQTYASQEQQHLNSINQMLNGQVPQTQQQGQGQQNQQSQGQQQSGQQMNQQMGQQINNSQGGMQMPGQAGMTNQNDANLCNDALMTEKYVSGAYNTAIFEFTDSNMRQVLNHIQKEEQKHGEGLFNYMRTHGMYNVNQ